MNHLGKRTGEEVLRKHHGQIALDVAPLEEAERDFFDRAVRAQLVTNGEERMLRERRVRRRAIVVSTSSRIWSKRPAR